MNLTKEEFKYKIQNINNKISEKYKNNDVPIFYDGAFNPDEYFDSPIKIMWLMKEPYGEAFSYPDFYNNDYDKFYKDLVLGRPKATWQPVIYISFSILNGFLKWEKMQEKNDIQKMAKVLGKIAWVNIQKGASETGTTTNMNNIDKAFRNYYEIIEYQINILNPQIIICGNTFKVICKHMGNPKPNEFETSEMFVPHYIINDRLYLDPYHPAYPAYGKIDLGLYVNDIIKTAKKYLQQ